MGELGASVGVGVVRPMSQEFSRFEGVLGPQLELGYQHALTPGLQVRVSWRMLSDLDARSTGLGVGLGLGLPAQFILGGQVRMDSQQWELVTEDCLAAWCVPPKPPELSIAGSLTRASVLSERLVLEYGVHVAAGVASWSTGSAQAGSQYRSASAQVWFWPNRA